MNLQNPTPTSKLIHTGANRLHRSVDGSSWETARLSIVGLLGLARTTATRPLVYLAALTAIGQVA